MKSWNGYKLSPEAAARQQGLPAPAGRSVQAATIDSAGVIAGASDMFEWFGGGARAAGINVTPENAMRLTTVWRCVTLIAGRNMTAPLVVYERTGGAPKPLHDHELTRFLQVEPNELMSGPEHVELQTMAILLRGNGYAVIRQARNGVIQEIEYFHPARVTPFWSGRSIWYRCTHFDGETEDIDSSRVLHFKGPGLTWDGLRALSPIQHHAQALGIGMAARDFTARQFEQGLLTNDYFSFEEAISEEQRKDFKEYLRKRATGLGGAHNPLLLEKGGKWDRLSITAKDAQLLELLQFSATDIACLFGVPPHLTGQSDKQSNWGTGIEQQNIGLESYTMMPHRERIASELSRKFFPAGGRSLPKYFIDFDPEAQLRGDMKSRGEFARLALGGNQLPGFLSQNEVRGTFGKPAVEGGDDLYRPSGEKADPDPTPTEETGEDAAQAAQSGE